MSETTGLRKHLSPLGAWAFSIGTAVGWGSLVVTASTYLVQAGPAGSVLGLAVGATIMVAIALCYAYLMRSYPEAGGAYAFTREVFGYDQAFLTAWFLAMTYLAVLWANMTSLPLFGRIFLGGIFRVGKLYTLFGYDVYLGEALLSMTGLVVFGLLCMRNERVTDVIMIALAATFSGAIIVCFLGSIVGGASYLQPAFVPDSSALSQIVKIAVISPWAFIGFESISHATEEMDFGHDRLERVLLIAVASTLALYALITLLSVTAYPPQYDSWLAYIRDLDSLEGIQALPAFYAASVHLGNAGVWMLMLALLALVMSSLVGNITALSRLFYAMAKDRILPRRFATLSERGVPSKAVLLVMGISLLVPLVGRTAIGWIVDVTTIGATLIYGLVGAAAASFAQQMDDKRHMWLGRAVLAVMIAFGAYVLLPNLVAHGSLARETYFLFIAWSVLGFLFFRNILQRDDKGRFGSSMIVWVALLSLVLFVALVWMRQSMIESNEVMLANIQDYYAQTAATDGQRLADETFVEQQIGLLGDKNTQTILMAVGMFAFAVAIMFTNHTYLNRRSRENAMLANIDPMTGVKSKHAYLVRERELDGEITDGTAKDFAVVVCDVNGLKQVNDTLGHKAGDQYIKDACHMVCEIFQHSPVFRVGGDEFVALLTGGDYALRKELVLLMHDRSVRNIGQGGVVISAGVSDYVPGQDSSVHMVFERADAIMYEEKQLLKGMGAVTRESFEEEQKAKDAVVEQPDIMNVKRQILIVEDEKVNQMILGMALTDDYEVLYAADGVEALDQVHAHKGDLALVLLDLQMPRMGGLEVLKSLKEDEEVRGIPVIVLTADQAAEVECLEAGAADFIPKPYPKVEIVRARVNKCIELSETKDMVQSTERDSLTKLFNMSYFMRYVQMYDQHYWDMAMDAVVLDVNHFRMINERYGRSYGNDVLRRIGEHVRAISREVGGVGCRQGADTFLIYCPHRDDYHDILDKASEGLAGEEADAADRVRLRMGIYAAVDKNLSIEQRFENARIAASTVRGSFIESIGIYDNEMHEKELYRARLVEDFRPSLERGDFMVYFQPKFDIRPDRPLLSSAEALVRWNHPELGMISPAVLIPLLEENGLILEMDKYVWRKTAEQIRAWKDRFGFAVPVSVNVSRIDMLTPNLKDIFTEILDTYDLDVDDFALEITESAYAGDSEQVISAARELRGMGMGFRIEMDDFGTGYSSLGMLSHLPVDALKLDMSFIRNAFGEVRDVRMIELIIDVADYLHVPVVAEGVETEEQYLVLKTMGCDYVQGYYFSRPVPADEFDQFLVERGERSVEMTPEAKKTYMSISKALISNFESIFYIDMVTDFYLEFYADRNGDLEIRPGGTDFFVDMSHKLLGDVVPADLERVQQSVSKETLRSWMESEESLELPFRRIVAGEQRDYLLQTIRTRSSDDHHIVIGIHPAEEDREVTA